LFFSDLTSASSTINAYLSSTIKFISLIKNYMMALATDCTGSGTTANRKNKTDDTLAMCAVEEDVLRAEWAVQVQEQTKPLPHKLVCHPIKVV
jgi:hypothetical protein